MSSTSYIGWILGLFFLILLSSFFSAAETAYSSIDKITIEKNVESGKKSAKLIKKHYKIFGRVLSTILIGNNVVNVALSSITTFIFATALGSSAIVTIIATATVTPMLVIFGEIFPKLLAKKYSYIYLTNIVFIIEILTWIFFPLTFLFSKLTLSTKTNITEGEVKSILKIAAKQKELIDDEAIIASKALELDSKKVEDIMVNSKDVESIKYGSTIQEALNIFKATGHSRIPVISANKYNGVILLKDLFSTSDKSASINSYILNAPRIKKHTSVIKSLEIMRENLSHIAFIFNKTSTGQKVIGIVTIEDIVEEMVGEIYDEHDLDDSINQIGPHKWIAGGNLPMRMLGEAIDGVNFESVDDLTIKQWVQKRMKSKIKFKHKYTYDEKIIFTVIANENHRETIFKIKKILK